MSEYNMNESPNEIEKLLTHVKQLQQDIETLFAQKEKKTQALLNACNVRKYSIKQSEGMTLEEAKQSLETHRKRYQAAIRASESAKIQMRKAEKNYKEAVNRFRKSSDDCDKQEKNRVKKISKEFANQIKNKQKELRDLEHKIRAATQKFV
ncbi:MAG: hypothetical protein JW776_05850 [Candidatus Lokiarchaeota archaeon]|nr:hypothetical protein [Candidatus Lokiarchaeota archaeon]